MADEFKKLSEVDVAEAVSDSGHLIAEDGGKIVRVPVGNVGSGGVTVYYMKIDDLGNLADPWLYKNAECTEKPTKFELMEAARNTVIAVQTMPRDPSEYINFRFASGVLAKEQDSYGSVKFTVSEYSENLDYEFLREEHLYTAEYEDVPV